MSRARHAMPAMLALLAILALLAVGACTGDLDPKWQLDHDRIVAVRATPPGIASGSKSTIDALVAKKGDKVRVAAPELATVVSPASLSDALSFDGGNWVVTAPSEDRLIAARAELKLADGAPVPLEVGVSYAGQTLLATKTVSLGAAVENLMLAATDLGYASCWVAAPIFCPEEARDALALPEEWLPHALVMVGYPDPKYVGRARPPVPLDEIRRFA